MVDAARALLVSLLTGAPLGALADELAEPSAIEGLAAAFEPVPGAFTLGVHARAAQLPHADPALAAETLALVAPLADRLGLSPARAALEDGSFAVLDPVAFAALSADLGPAPSIHQAVDRLAAVLSTAGVRADLSGRIKSTLGVARKMEHKGVAASQIHDRVGLRAIVADEAACYAALAAVHHAFVQVPGEFDDYIAHPKPSGYRSLHTAVVLPGLGTVEVQVRTKEMHAQAESGSAAHWRYKLG